MKTLITSILLKYIPPRNNSAQFEPSCDHRMCPIAQLPLCFYNIDISIDN